MKILIILLFCNICYSATMVATSPTGGNETDLVACYPMDSAGTVGWDGTAGEVIDITGNGHDGKSSDPTSASTTTVAKFGYAGKFTGGAHVVIPHDDAFTDNVTSCTITAWIKSSAVDNKRIFGKFGTNHEFLLYFSGVNLLFWIFDNQANSIKILNDGAFENTVEAGGWHFVAAVWDGGLNYTDLRLYLNGVEGAYDSGLEAGSFDGIRDDSSNTVKIGTNWTDEIDDVAFYERDLSDEEIMALYIKQGHSE